MKKEEKYRQIAKEAKYSFFALVAVILFWIAAGFGVSRCSITIFHTPLWVITGCVGTWIFAIFLVLWLNRFVFKDFSLEEEEEGDA